MANASTYLNDPMDQNTKFVPTGIIANKLQGGAPASGGGIISQNMMPTNVNASIPVTNPTGTPPATPDYLSQSKGLYNKYLGRDGDQEGINYWADELKKGKSIDEVTNAFKNSANIVYQDFAGHAAQTPENMAYLSGKYKPDALDLVNGDVNSGAAVDFMRNGIVSKPSTITPPTPSNSTGQNSLFTVSPNPVASGIIGSQVAGYAPTTLSNPTKWKVDPNQTVQAQMTSMIDPNSPYYQAWKTAGAQDAAARGFTGNSSIRDTSIMDAIIRNATPIATSDASTYAKAAGYNADTENNFAIKNQEASNSAGQFNSGAANTMAQAKLSSDTSKYATDKGSATSLATAQISADTQKYVSNLSSDTQAKIANLNNASQAAISKAHDDNAVLLSSNSDAQNAFRDYVNSISIIQNNDKMSGEAKAQAMIANQSVYNSRINEIKDKSPNTPANIDSNEYAYNPESSTTNHTQAKKLEKNSGIGGVAQDAVNQVKGVDVTNLVNFEV